MEDKKRLARNGKTYNEVLNEKGTKEYLLATLKTKEGEIKKAVVFIPQAKITLLNQAKGWSLPCDSNIKVVLRAGAPVMVLKLDEGGNYTGEVQVANYSNQTSRGKRLHEKLLEGAIDLIQSFSKGVDVVITTNENLTPAPDCYKGGATEYTIDDLLNL